MPATVSGIPQRLTTILDRLQSPELIESLGQSLAESLSSNAPVASGATARALAPVGEPERTTMGWWMGVGNDEAVGSKDTQAPRGTLRAFFDYLENSVP